MDKIKALNGPITVLLADPNATFMNVMANFLSLHHEIVIVDQLDNIDDVMSVVITSQPRIILIDLTLCNSTNTEWIRHLRESQPDTCIIILTSLDAELYRSTLLATGANDVVYKSEIGSQLIPIIYRCASTPCSD